MLNEPRVWPVRETEPCKKRGAIMLERLCVQSALSMVDWTDGPEVTLRVRFLNTKRITIREGARTITRRQDLQKASRISGVVMYPVILLFCTIGAIGTVYTV